MDKYVSLNIIAPVVFAVMALIAPWSSDTRSARVFWTIGFVVVGVIAVYAGVKAQQKASAESAGSDQYFLVSFIFSFDANPNAKFPLAVSNYSDLPIYEAAFSIALRDDYFATNKHIAVGAIYRHETFRPLDLALPLGDYVIELRNKAGGWYFERLILSKKEDGTIHQSYYIRKFGSEKKLWDVQ